MFGTLIFENFHHGFDVFYDPFMAILDNDLKFISIGAVFVPVGVSIVLDVISQQDIHFVKKQILDLRVPATLR